jgi:DNA-binding MarR family transcriptional regulator
MLLIEPTDTGKQVANAFRPIVHQHQKVWMDILNEKEQEQLLNFLKRLQESLIGSDS